MFQSFLFPLVFANIYSNQTGESAVIIWPWLVAGSSILAIILAPFTGKLGDLLGKWKVFTWCVCLAGILGIFSQLLTNFSWLLVALFFLLFNTAFELSQSLYDAFLLNIEKEKDGITKLSSFAWGFGYLGGALFAIIYFIMEGLGLSHTLMLIVFGILYLLLSSPSIFGFKRIEKRDLTSTNVIDWKKIFHPTIPVPWSHLFVYWIIADCVAALIYFVPLYLQSELLLSMNLVGGIILGAQLLAFPLTILMGRLAIKIGRIKTIQVSLFIWIATLLGLFFATSVTHVLIIALLMSFVIGSTQAILRAHFASRIHEEKSGEGLGFYAVAQKSASVISPLLVGLTITLTGNLRPAFLILTLLVVIAFFLAPQLHKKAS